MAVLGTKGTGITCTRISFIIEWMTLTIFYLLLDKFLYFILIVKVVHFFNNRAPERFLNLSLFYFEAHV